MAICEDCKENVTENVENYSKEHFGKVLCIPCQDKVRAGEGKKEEEKGTLGSFASGAKESDDEMEKYDNNAELEAEEKELDEKIIALVTAMSVPDESKFHAWLESEYGVNQIADLDLQGKRKVLGEMERVAEMGKKVIEPEVVGDEEKSKWHHTVEIDEGEFSFREVDGKL